MRFMQWDFNKWDLVGTIAASLTTFGFVPQILQMHETQSVTDVSLYTLLQFCLGNFLWLLYGLNLNRKVLYFSNAASFLGMILAIGLYLKYSV
jgi:MtN3 and saliva related transmembrane protein